jgi:hypothetical protein
MYKQLHAYEQFTEGQLKRYENKLKDASADERTKALVHVERLRRYHETMVHDFQHERLIHLIVTLFFAGLLLLNLASLVWSALLPLISENQIISGGLGFISLILAATELFYIRHYYQLENGTQRLYALSKKLYDVMQ